MVQPQLEVVKHQPSQTLDIDFLMLKVGRSGDRWWVEEEIASLKGQARPGRRIRRVRGRSGGGRGEGGGPSDGKHGGGGGDSGRDRGNGGEGEGVDGGSVGYGGSGDMHSRFEAIEIVVEQGYVVENIAAMWYKSPKDETEVGLRMLHTDKDAMDMTRIGMRDNMVEFFIVHKKSATARKGCTIEKVQEIDGDEPTAPTAGTVRPGLIVLHKAQSSA
ncbi:hypothetical protein Ahy_B07g087029 [Arachis hypogaea]|uniref:PB1-like domain-containing protein n=1 Tax=Arachis hypogaea TaxID=3818 RepID=A0A444YBF6_ARAHY|nr:hypothetical protein Ahy_B07g087029 [Arachis hypogaea]